jgi:CubicO group peptidase (beta-lactamase class C family)
MPTIQTRIQNIINAHVTGNMGMAVYVFSNFQGSGPPTTEFFYPTENPIWNANHDVVSPEKLPGLLFEIGSISKVFTSRIFYSLQNGYGTQTIGSCMPSISLPAIISGLPVMAIGVYTSGFPQDNGHPPDPRGAFCPASNLKTFADMVSWFNSGQHADWICKPGACYTYSNLSWSLLAIAGFNPQSTNIDVYAAYNNELRALCEVWGMNSTGLFKPTQVGANMACGYRNNAPFDVGASYQPTTSMGFGAGGVVSCATDMLQWLLYNMGQLPASSTDRDILIIQQQPNSSLPVCGTTTGACGAGEATGPQTAIGWFFPKVSGPGQVLAKDGGVRGFSSWMGFEGWVNDQTPSENGVVVLSAGQNAAIVGRKIMAILLDAEIEALPPGDFPSDWDG